MNDSAATNADGTDLSVLVSDIAVLDGDDTNTIDNLASTLDAMDAQGTWDDGDGTWYTGRVIFDSDKSFSITTAGGRRVSGCRLHQAPRLPAPTAPSCRR